ncbi:phage tail tape measure protein [Streptomyces sp. bgisy154]|uniref:phage tail tape measure protein n=1 Tax=Streptomyces sp. bgisy154 TaxID=3413794 RepID=UPI003D738761
MPNVGYATLQIIPSVRGIGDEIRRQLIGPAGDAGGDAGEAAGGSLKEKLLVGAAAAGAAAGALLVAGVSEAIDQANITSHLQAQLGATSKDSARYGKIAGDLYAQGITESVAEGAEVIRSVVNAGLVPPDATNAQLKSISAQMADVAATFGTDMSLQTQAVSALMKNGLAPSAEAALDVITAGMQKLGPNAEDLLETFQEYPVQLKKLGIDADEALGLFRQGLQGGARDTDIVADALKEFGIRSIDMSTASREAYKSLGLDAQTMERMIGKGGESAQQGLQIVLDKLRSIHDPVKREAAAVGLFGTQAEELGTSLFKLDPSRATKAMGDVSGAAADLGETLHSGPGHEIEVFTRTLKQGFVAFVGAQVLPAITAIAHTLNGSLVPVLSTTSSIIASVIGWFREWGIWLAPLAIAIGGVTLALNAQAIATGLVTTVFSVYRAAILVGTAVTNGFAAAQALLNSVMALNPFVLIAIAVVALGAALVIAWKRSETFRSIVMAAWQGIQAAAMWAWDNALKPLIDGLVAGWKYVASGAMWLWDTVLEPVFGFISTAARIVATIYGVIFLVAFKAWWSGVKLYAGLVMTALQAVGDAAMWLWNNAISPVIDWIVAGFKLWWTGVKTYLDLVSAGFQTVGGWAMWLYRHAIQPAMEAVVGVVKQAWASAQVVFGFFVGGLRTVGSWAKWLWTKAIGPAMSGIRSAISYAWTSGIQPVFNTMKTAVGLVGKAFEAAKDAIKVAWDKVKGIAKAPVVFVVNTVYGKLRGVWNTVAKAFGAPTLPEYKFATGGILPGYTPGRDVHLAALSGGEAVMRPEWTRAVGPGYVNAMNVAARHGGVRGVQRALGLPGFKDGGIFGWIGKTASKGVDLAKAGVSWLKDGIKASALAGLNKLVRPLIEKISGSASLYRDMITAVPKRMISAILDFSGKADGKLEAAGIGGKGYKAGLAWARTQTGKPYQWGGNGDPSWDCSGFLSAIESVIRGQKPHRRWATGAFSGATAPAGWGLNRRSPFMIGITNAGVGHTAGTLNGVNVESRGGDGVLVGARARSYRDSLFTDVYGLKYDAGGWLTRGQPGVNLGDPEAVLTPAQSTAFVQMAAAAAQMAAQPARARETTAAAGSGLQSGDRLRLVVNGHEFDTYVERLADGRVTARDTRMGMQASAGRRQ